MYSDEFPPQVADLLALDRPLWLRLDPRLIFPRVLEQQGWLGEGPWEELVAGRLFVYLGENRLTQDSHSLWFGDRVVTVSWRMLWNHFRIVQRV